MKRLIAFCLTLCLAAVLAGCGSSPSQPEEPRDYAAILTAACGGEPAAPVITSPSEDIYGLLELYELDESLMKQYAVSFSAMNTSAYGVAIILPAEGKAKEVKEKLQAFIQSQMTAQENYLPDQYAIAKAAKLDTMKTGEVVLVMSEDGDAIFKALSEALKT